MTLFILRYVSCLLIFGIGLHAPGIIPITSNSYESFENYENNHTNTTRDVSF